MWVSNFIVAINLGQKKAMIASQRIYKSEPLHVVIPPSSNAVENTKAAPMRNRDIQEIKEQGRMAWQKNRNYARRNLSELAMLRYQKMRFCREKILILLELSN